MILRFILFLSVTLAFLITSCAPEHSKIVVAEYGGNKVTMDEFEEAYAKNAGGYEEAKDDSLSKLKSFLDLYVNFKMKLRDAQIRGYDKNPALQDELLDYKKKVGVTYLLEKQLVEPGIKNLYDKRKVELRVSHLMIRPDTAGNEAAKALAQSLLDSIQAGADYVEMVKRHSQDQFSSPAGGDIFYVTGGMLPVEFENAIYDAEPGTVYPEVVETKYGFHIIKVTERRDRIPQVRASHILINYNNDEGEIDSAAARARIDSIMAQLKEGGDFAELAKTYSEDPTGNQQGGDLGFFERRQMVKEFDETAFNLEVGEISGVVATNFGYHIIKVTDKKPYPSYEEEKENLKKMYKQISYQAEYDAFIDSLREKYNYSLNEENMVRLAEKLDSVKIGSELPEMDETASATVFTYSSSNVNAKELMENINSNSEYLNRVVNKDFLSGAINKVSGEYLLEAAALDLEFTNREFASLMEDYRNGIYIFKLQEDEVWNKVKLDSARLYEHYLDTKENYVWPDRVSFSEIYVKSDSAAQAIYAQLQEGANFDTLAVQYTQRPGYQEKAGLFSLQDAKQTQLAVEADKLKNPGDYSAPFSNTGGFSIVRLNEKEPSRIKTFEEAKAEVSGSFQEAESKRLEQAYLQSLAKRYDPEYNYDKLEKAFKPEE